MTNREVARIFNKLAKVMELHGENHFKIRSYSNAYNTIRRWPDDLLELTREELLAINGIGKNIADKIEELKESGQIATLQRYLDKTPSGIVDLLSIKGLGAKKILLIWKELGIESPGELLYACEENRLIDLKGFGMKTQQNLHDQLVYFLDAQGKYLYGHVEDEALALLSKMRFQFTNEIFDFINDMRRKMPIIETIEIIGTLSIELIYEWFATISGAAIEDGTMIYEGSQIKYKHVDKKDYNKYLFLSSGSEDFLVEWNTLFGGVNLNVADKIIFSNLDIEYIPPESREYGAAISRAKAHNIDLIENEHLKGVIHAHSTYSDGANTLADMARETQHLGYQYLVISDHSQSAFYANGLKEDRIYQQMEEIDRLNAANPLFRIFKGIESDILYNGQLDYDDEVLAMFDIVIASVHSNLKMDIVKATDRIITAVHNKYTRILGHPTGRLLLSREGYPIDHMAVIDACADCNVVIEINANPYRLDLDWTWIPYAIEKDIKISINPDAHNIKGISDMQYGVIACRKALVRPADCLNALDLSDFCRWVTGDATL